MATREGIYTISSTTAIVGHTLKEVCPVIPWEIGGEISSGGIDPILTIECFAVGVKDNLVFAWNLDPHTIVRETAL